MPKQTTPVLGAIRDAIEGIEAATAGKTYEEFCADWLLRHGVQRGIEIISEASRRIPQELLDKHPEIPWHKVKAIGNVLRHDYHDIVDEVIWRIVEDDLGPLKLAVSRMLQEAGEG
jgi:uncharacterized protein with HEPN domain